MEIREAFAIFLQSGLTQIVVMRSLPEINRKGVSVTVNYRAVHLLNYYRERLGFKRGMYPQAERIGDSTISLPLYPGLSTQEIEHVIWAVQQAVLA